MFVEAFLVVFTLCWCAGTVYFLYTFANKLDGALHYAPTNCTILQFTYDSDDNLEISVNYTVPSNNFNYTSFMVNIDENKSYLLNSTIPCFYSLHNPSLVMAQPGITAGTIIGVVFAIIMCIPVAAGVLLLIGVPVILLISSIRKWAKSTAALAGNAMSNMSSSPNSQLDNSQDVRDAYTPAQSSILSIFHYYAMKPVGYCKVAFKSTTSWLAARFTWTRSSKQGKDIYDLEDQGSYTTRASSGYSFKSTKKLLSHSKSQRSEISDQTSVETRSL